MRLFLYLSEFLNKPVYDSKGQYVGKLFDMGMLLSSEVFPKVEDVVIRRGWIKPKYYRCLITEFLSFDDVRGLKLKKSIHDLEQSLEKIRPEFSICYDVLDQQVVDVHDQKVVRVNDVHMLRVDDQIYLAHVDIGLRGIFRRLEWTGFIDGVVKIFSSKSSYLTQEELLSWRNSQVLTIGRKKNILKMSDARKKLARIPPSELADIMEDLDIFEKVSLFKSFSVDLQRKVFTDLSPNEKEDLIDQFEDHEIVNLLENIPADEATDLLSDVEKDKRVKWLRLMESDSSKQLRKLLGYAEDSAGGLMTTEYISVKQDATVGDAMSKIKNNVENQINLYHVYIVDDEQRLLGMTSLRHFINEPDEKLLLETTFPTKMFVRTDDDVEEIALLLEKYKFSSIPVLDENDVMQGVITSDDVMEELISLIWTKYKDQI